MTRSAVGLLVALTCSGLLRPAAAQTCLGTASFDAGHVQLGAATTLLTGQSSTAARLGAGNHRIFGGLSVAIDYFTGLFPYPEGWALEGSGWIGWQVRVTATNTTGDYVNVHVGGPPFVLFQSTPTVGSGIGFSVRIDDSTGKHVGPSVDTWGQPVFVFQGGETQAYEDSTLVNNASWPLPVGTYRVIGYFGGVAGPAAALVVTP